MSDAIRNRTRYNTISATRPSFQCHKRIKAPQGWHHVAHRGWAQEGDMCWDGAKYVPVGERAILYQLCGEVFDSLIRKDNVPQKKVGNKWLWTHWEK